MCRQYSRHYRFSVNQTVSILKELTYSGIQAMSVTCSRTSALFFLLSRVSEIEYHSPYFPLTPPSSALARPKPLQSIYMPSSLPHLTLISAVTSTCKGPHHCQPLHKACAAPSVYSLDAYFISPTRCVVLYPTALCLPQRP